MGFAWFLRQKALLLSMDIMIRKTEDSWKKGDLMLSDNEKVLTVEN